MNSQIVELTKASRKLQDATWDLLVHLVAWENLEPRAATRGAVVRLKTFFRSMEELEMTAERLSRFLDLRNEDMPNRPTT